MKRFATILLSICMSIPAFASVASAAPTTDPVQFFVQIEGKNMDKDGHISSQETKYFTDAGFKTTRVEGATATTFEKDATSEEWLQYAEAVPNDDDVFDKVKNDFVGKAFIKAFDGNVVSWKSLNGENYRMYWYVFKNEVDGWHIDGVIVDKRTEEQIGIVVPEDPSDIPPEADEDPDKPVVPENPEYNIPDELENNYAYIFGRSDTLMQAEDGMHRGEVAAVLHRLLKQNNKLGGFAYDVDAAPKFKDVEGRWDRSALEYMEYLGLYEKDTIIRPDQNITRGEAFKMMAVALGFTKDTTLSAEQYAAILVDAGYIQGDDNGNLMLDEIIQRCQVCKIYNKLVNRTGKLLKTADGEEVTPETYGFIDIDESAWYYKDVLLGTSAFDGDYVSLELRGIRNALDDYVE
ncbi:MAG: S-layer homology domain-containing protein [Clostridia bacterium]|nr:S-layer homology domain-containing protein [Clostridia bacterium]